MSEHWTPKSKEELLTVIEHEWTLLMDLVARLTPTQLTTPDAGGWTPKDNIAHLMEWMKYLLYCHMDRQPAHEVMGVAPEMFETGDYTDINAIVLERNRARTADDILDEMRRVYAKTLDRLKATSFEDLLKPRFPDEPESPTLLAYVLGNTSSHFEEHRENIEKGLKR